MIQKIHEGSQIVSCFCCGKQSLVEQDDLRTVYFPHPQTHNTWSIKVYQCAHCNKHVEAHQLTVLFECDPERQQKEIAEKAKRERT